MWLGRLLEKEKAKYNREIEDLKAKYATELETYRARLERSTFITRANFDTEFDAYKQLFAGLGQVRLAMFSIRPLIEVKVLPPDEPRLEKLKRLSTRVDLLVEAHNQTVKVSENLCPFYPLDIHEKVEAHLGLARQEMLYLQAAGDTTFSPEWYEQGMRRLDKFMDSHRAVTEAVRNRISTLAILPR